MEGVETSRGKIVKIKFWSFLLIFLNSCFYQLISTPEDDDCDCYGWRITYLIYHLFNYFLVNFCFDLDHYYLFHVRSFR